MAIIYYATEIHIDFGVLSELGDRCRSIGIRRPLLVTDGPIVAQGIADRAIAALGGLEHRLFADATPNPLEKAVHSGCKAYADAQCDGLVALGGGSVIDTAKAIGLLASNGGCISDYVGPNGREIARPLPPTITVPTNAGSGSEISRGLGIGVGENGSKANLLHPKLFPTLALCDPDLTISVPPKLTAMSAIDALSHCIEGFISPRLNPPVAAIALDGISRISQHIEAAVAQPENRDARWEMMMGSVEGGMAMPKGLGPAHSLGIPLDRLHLPHGAIIAVLLPKVVRWYGSSLDGKRGALLHAMGLKADADLPEALESLASRLGLANSLRALDVPRSIFDEIAENAVASPYHAISLKPASKNAYIDILESAF